MCRALCEILLQSFIFKLMNDDVQNLERSKNEVVKKIN